MTTRALLNCVLVGTWTFANAVAAPQFGSGVTEEMAIYLCVDPGGPPHALGEPPTKPSVGIEVRRGMTLEGQPVTGAIPSERFCFIEGRRADTEWRCPDFRNGGAGAGGPFGLPRGPGGRP